MNINCYINGKMYFKMVCVHVRAYLSFSTTHVAIPFHIDTSKFTPVNSEMYPTGVDHIPALIHL